MKKIKNIYNKIISKENLYRAARAAAKCRRYKESIANFYFYLEEEINRLQKELVARAYRHGKYRVFTIFEPKKRNIGAAPFRDRVIHHAVNGVIEPMIDRSFIFDSYACRNGKGMHKAVDRAQKFLRSNNFCLHCDVKQYFPSIDHGILKRLLHKRIADKNLIWLLDEIIDSSGQLTPEEGRGLPIGNLTSQFFANLYLNELDRFVKHNLKCRYYLRYMDDFLIFDKERLRLKDARSVVGAFLETGLKLRLNQPKSQIYRCHKGIKFLGFRIYPFYRRLAADNVRRFKKRMACMKKEYAEGRIKFKDIAVSIRCWLAHAAYANTKRLRLRLIADALGMVKMEEGKEKRKFLYCGQLTGRLCHPEERSDEGSQKEILPRQKAWRVRMTVVLQWGVRMTEVTGLRMTEIVTRDTRDAVRNTIYDNWLN